MPDASATLAEVYTTVPVRNTDPKSGVCFSSPGQASIEWGYAGIPDGTDVQEIPLAVWNSAPFRKQKAKGRLVQDSQEALEQAAVAQQQAAATAANERQAEIDAAMAAGATSVPLVITADKMDAIIGNAAHNEAAEALAQAEDAQRIAQEQAQQRYEQSRSPEADPMSAITDID